MKRLVRFIRPLCASRSQMGMFAQAALYLLLTAGLVAALMAVSACDCNDNGIDDCDYEKEEQWRVQQVSLANKLAKELKPDSEAKITDSSGEGGRASGQAAPGQHVQRLLGLEVTGGTPPDSVAYTWVPPMGAGNFSFPGRQPEPDGPPFEFLDVPPDEQIPVEFDLPTEGPSGGNRLPESLTARPDTDLPTTAYYLTTLTSQAASLPDVPGPAPAEPAPARPEAVVDMWTVVRWFTRPITVSSEACQQAVDLLQSDAPFLAIQLPEPPHAVTESALLPIYYNPNVELVDYDGGLDVAAEATFRPERFAFAANELPAEEGKIWATLGVSTTPPLACPTGLETGDWELFTLLTLDLSFAPDNCTGCVLDLYLCYEGQELPGSSLERYVARQQIDRTLEKLARATDGAPGVQSYQDWGITCAGPLPLQLVHATWDDWEVTGTSAQWATPTMPITLPHVLRFAVPNPPQLIDLEYSAALDAGWRWSDGAQIITPPISYEGDGQNLFLVGTVPAGTPGGLYTVQVTATLVSTPTDYRLASDVIWVGDWVPPLEPLQHHVYLPLVLRAH